MRIVKKVIVSVLRIAAGVPIVSLLAVGLLFFVLSATLTGRSAGLSGVVIAAVLFCSVGYPSQG